MSETLTMSPEERGNVILSVGGTIAVTSGAAMQWGIPGALMALGLTMMIVWYK